jgi:hypothetical protein
MNVRRFAAACLATLSLTAGAAPFGHPGGPEPGNLDEVVARLGRDPYDLELLVSFGTSKGGSAGHLALAIRQEGDPVETVHSANFYADRTEEHAKGFYNAELMTRIPKDEYLFRTRSSLGPDAAFGLDYGEIYKRSVVGIRVYGPPRAERAALAAYFDRINADFHARAPQAEYHAGEIRYDYMRLNCAKTIGVAFRYGAGYDALAIKDPLLPGPVAKAINANIPTEMAVKLMREWDARGYRMDVVLYRKWEGSTFVDPREPGGSMFKDLPNRFPSVLSFDFSAEAGAYEDYDNLYAMYLLYNLGRYSVRVDGANRLVIEADREPMPYQRAAELAAKNAEADSRRFLRRLPFIPDGLRIGAPADNRRILRDAQAAPKAEVKP